MLPNASKCFQNRSLTAHVPKSVMDRACDMGGCMIWWDVPTRSHVLKFLCISVFEFAFVRNGQEARKTQISFVVKEAI